MIIRDHRKNRILSPRLIGYLLLVGVAMGVLFFLLSKPEPRSGPFYLLCSMEDTVTVGGKVMFRDGSTLFQHGETRSDEEAHGGRHSSKIYEELPFGATWESAEIGPGEIYEARIWRKSESGDGHFIASGDWGLYQNGAPTGRRTPDGWEEMVIKVEVPRYILKGVLKIYPYNPERSAVFFDDLELRKITKGELAARPEYGPADSIRTLNILLGEKGEKKLQDKRDEALLKGLLKSSDDDWVNCKLEEGNRQFTGELRLKGDWTDHLHGDKWSFRISLATGQAWNRLETFSVHSPETRYMLAEWVFHRWLEMEDILTPRYDFIELKVNNKSRGVYAWEEHFMKQLPEHSMRREGPILKYVEDGYWDLEEVSIENDYVPLEKRVPVFRSSDIEAFGMGRILKDSVMKRQYIVAQNLAYEYKHGLKSIWEVFDVDRVARYYAIVDVCQAQHGFIWHNQRMYYNPVISKLEPIGFDGYTYSGPFGWILRPFLGYARNVRYMEPGYREQMFERFFHDEAFMALYVKYLYQFTSPDYLDRLFAEIGRDLTQREQWLQKEWPEYRYERNSLYDQAIKLRLLMMPQPRTSLKVHLQGKGKDGRVRFKVFNYHNLPVRPLGLGKKKGKVDVPFEDSRLIDAYHNEFPAEFLDMYAAGTGQWAMFRIPGIDSVFSVEVMEWPAPEAFTPEQELFSGLQLAGDHVYEVDEANKMVWFRTGRYQTGRDILIPPGYQVRFEPGVELDLIRKAKFISKSQVVALGTAERPVHIHSSDSSANGFTLLQAPGKSEFHHVQFDHFNTLDYKGWNLTGAVTLYETECLFKNSRFLNSQCEDALNLVRCIFTMESCLVAYTAGDGFDADFCTGVINHCFFSHTTNDGMDFSGSNIRIDGCEVDHAGDKGISLGEESTIELVSARITNSVMGLVAKDLTTVHVQFVELKGNQTAIALYQKKPEYGPAIMDIEESKLEDNGEDYLVQVGSVLKMGKRTIQGKR